MASKRNWSLRRSRPLAQGSAWPRAKHFAEPKPAQPTSPFFGGSVLPTIEELITRILGLVVRTLGTLTLGVAALCQQEPAKRLEELERAGRVLPWGTVVLLASALLSVWLGEDPNEDSARQLLSVLDDENGAYRYVDRVIPALAIGILLAAFGWLVGNRFGGAQGGHRTRLLTATMFGLTLVAACAYYSAYAPINPSLLHQGLTLVMYGLCILTGRIAWISVPSGKPRNRVAAFLVRALAAVLAAVLPLVLFTGTGTLMRETAPYLSSRGLWPSLAEDPQRRIVFKPMPTQCKPPTDNVMVCTLAASTSGRASAFFMDRPIKVSMLPKEVIAPSAQGYRNLSQAFQYQFNEGRSKLHDIFNRELKAELVVARVLAPEPKEPLGLVALEAGKPLIIELKFAHQLACTSLSPRKSEERLFVALEQLGSSFGETVTFGPWTLSMDDWYCKPPPPLPKFAPLPINPFPLPKPLPSAPK